MTMKPAAISWTRDGYQTLKTAYNEALRANRQEFTIEIPTHPAPLKFDVGVASYMIEFLAADFRKPDEPRRPNLEGEEGQ
jgi:hypothetical protein